MALFDTTKKTGFSGSTKKKAPKPSYTVKTSDGGSGTGPTKQAAMNDMKKKTTTGPKPKLSGKTPTSGHDPAGKKTGATRTTYGSTFDYRKPKPKVKGDVKKATTSGGLKTSGNTRKPASSSREPITRPASSSREQIPRPKTKTKPTSFGSKPVKKPTSSILDTKARAKKIKASAKKKRIMERLAKKSARKTARSAKKDARIKARAAKKKARLDKKRVPKNRPVSAATRARYGDHVVNKG
jgi:hypothetical protein